MPTATKAPVVRPTGNKGQQQGPSASESAELGGFGGPKQEKTSTAQKSDSENESTGQQQARADMESAWQEATAAVGDEVPPGTEVGADAFLKATAGQQGDGQPHWSEVDDITALRMGQQPKPQEDNTRDDSQKKESEAQPELSADEVQEILQKAGNVATNGLPDLVAQVKVQRLRKGEVKDFVRGKLDGLVDKALHKTPEDPISKDPRLEKIAGGAKEYMGGVDYVARVKEINEAVSAARELANAKERQREALAWTAAFAPEGEKMFGDEQEIAQRAQKLTAQVEELSGQKDRADEANAARKELGELRDHLHMITRVREIRETEEFQELYNTQDIDGIKTKLEPFERDLTELTDEKMDELAQRFTTASNKIREVAQNKGGNTAEFVRFLDDLPEALIANPGSYENAQDLMKRLKSDKLKGLGQELFANLLLYLFGISFQQIQEGMN